MENQNHEFKLTREFNAPRSLMFKVWTEAEHLKNWWGPAGLEVGVAKLDLRPGGVFHYSMKTPDGNMMWGKFVYREIIEPTKLEFVASFSDADEGYTRHPMAAGWPVEILSTIEFTEHEGKTTLHMTGVAINASDDEVKTFVESIPSMNEGWGGTFAQLEAHLKTLGNK